MAHLIFDSVFRISAPAHRSVDASSHLASDVTASSKLSGDKLTTALSSGSRGKLKIHIFSYLQIRKFCKSGVEPKFF